MQLTSAIPGTRARTKGRGWVEAQTHVPTAARAPVVTLAQALTLHAGPGTGLALPPQARRDGVVLDEPQESEGETARAQQTTQTSLRRRDARQMSRRKGMGIWSAITLTLTLTLTLT